MYTKIPHKKLIEVLNELIEFCFKGGSHENISVTNSGARWIARTSRKGELFDEKLVKEALQYLMDNCYFTFGDKLFRQVIGIPMGSDPAPFMANLFLFYYENKWISNLKKENFAKAHLFRNTFRFIDDLLTINDNEEFSKCFQEIYPPELELNIEHSGSTASFLDMRLEKQGGQFSMCLFDKRDSFPFSIVRMPYSSSNMPTRMFYSSIGAEILRISRVSSTLNNFVEATKPLMERVITQGADKIKLIGTVKKVYGRQSSLRQFGTTATDLVRSLFN